jgi:hypothetical protein
MGIAAPQRLFPIFLYVDREHRPARTPDGLRALRRGRRQALEEKRTAQLAAIYTCADTTWNQVGGSSTATIQPFLPQTGSGLRTSSRTSQSPLRARA